MATVGDLKIERLLERIAASERRHAEEILNLEVSYLMKIQELTNEIDEMKKEGEENAREEDLQGSDESAGN